MSQLERKRGKFLTAWLILMVIAAVGAAFLVYALTYGTRNPIPWLVPGQIAISAMQIVCVVALFKWKKWGFYGFCGVAVISMIMNLGLGDIFGAAQNFIPICFLWAALASKWSYFE